MKKIKILLIGNGNHSKRIQKILRKKKINFNIFNYRKDKNLLKNDKFLKSFNVVFILSPNSSHFFYIKKFYKYSYIFCEKPPANNKNDFLILKKINHKKIYYNFNFRFSLLSKIFENIKKFKLGKLLYGNIIFTHALALKSDYQKSWLAKKRFAPNGVYENVTIHWIDLINYFFKIRKIEVPKLFNASKYSTNFDNSLVRLTINKKCFVDIFSSYTSPLIKKNIFVFDNGFIEQNEKFIKVFGPALNLRKNKFTKKPKLKNLFLVNLDSDYIHSLKLSVDYFFKIVFNNKTFKKNLYQKSLDSNSLLLF